MENISRQEGHGKVDAYLNIETEYSQKNPVYSDLVFDEISKLSTNDNQEKKGHKASILDLFNTKGLSKTNFLFIVHNMINPIEIKTKTILFDRNKTEFTKEGLKYINTILNESMEFYSSYMLRSVGPNFIRKRSKNNDEKIELDSTKKVREFFSNSSVFKNAAADRQIHCSLLKIAYAINDIKINEDKINKSEKDFGEVKKEQFFNNFFDQKGKEAKDSIDSENNDFRYLKLQTKCEKSSKTPIFFNCAGRVKRKEQILVKEISDPKYDSVAVIQDIYGIRNEVKTREDALFLLEYLRIHVLNRKGEISYKNIFGGSLEKSQAFVKEYAKDLDPDFYAAVYKSLKEDTTAGKNNKNYKDIKIRGELGGHSCEMQINLVDNKNETGYAHHLIFDCKKKIRALSRLQGYAPRSIIHRYIREAIDKSIIEAKRFGTTSELVALGGYSGSINKIEEDHIKKAEDKIFEYLLNTEQDILKLQIPQANNNLNYYTSRSIWNHFHKNGKYISLYPKGAKAKNTKNNERTDEEV